MITSYREASITASSLAAISLHMTVSNATGVARTPPALSLLPLLRGALDERLSRMLIWLDASPFVD
jgi:hypothetical protein